jgi:hypothetical protein
MQHTKQQVLMKQQSVLGSLTTLQTMSPLQAMSAQLLTTPPHLNS